MRWYGRRSTGAALDRLRRGGAVVVPASRTRLSFLLVAFVLAAAVCLIALGVLIEQFVTGDRDERIMVLLAPITWLLVVAVVCAGVLAPVAIVRRLARLDALVLTPTTFGVARERDARGPEGRPVLDVPMLASTRWDRIVRFRGERGFAKWPMRGQLFIHYDPVPDGSHPSPNVSAGNGSADSVATPTEGFMVHGARMLQRGYVGGPAALLDLLRRAHALGIEAAGSRPAR